MEPHDIPNGKILAVAFALLDIRQVEALVGFKKSWIYTRVKAGDFPAPVPMGERCVRWRSDEVSAWMQAKADARTGSTDTARHLKARKAVAARRSHSNDSTSDN